MIDRLEMFCSLSPLQTFLDALEGHIPDSRMKYQDKVQGLDKLSQASKLVREDEDLKSMHTSDINALYRRVVTIKYVAEDMQAIDEPYEFIVMYRPRYHKEKQDTFKIVCNPNKTRLSRLKQFLERTFFHDKKGSPEFYNSFRLGRVDFCHDLDCLTVEELFRRLSVSRKLRKHTSILSYKENDEDYLRVFSGVEMETFYIGKSDFVLRVYNKVLEAKHQIQVSKAHEWHVSKSLERTASLPLLTRLEIQVRDLGRKGCYEEVNKKSGEIFNYHVKYRDPSLLSKLKLPRFYTLETLQDIFDMRQNQCDVFSEVKIHDMRYYKIETAATWQQKAFNALVNTYGIDSAYRMLPRKKRASMQRATKTLKIDINKKLYNEVRTWLTT